MLRTGLALAFTFTLLGLGCLPPPAAQRGVALYPVGNTPLQPNQVARLNALLPAGSSPGAGATSLIKAVDGRDVSPSDTAFELLPGCHLVQTANRVLVAGKSTTLSAQLGPLLFPFRMRAGYEYTIVMVANPAVSLMRVIVYATERDPNGARTQEIQPATSASDVQTCREWIPPPS